MQKRGKYDKKKLMTRQEAADILGVSCQTITNYLNNGLLNGIRVGNYSYVFRESLEGVIDTAKDAIDVQRKFEEEKQKYEKLLEEYRTLSEELIKDTSLLRHTYGIRFNVINAICEMCNSADELGVRNFDKKTADILNMWIDGKDYSVIADVYGYTKERVRQIIVKGLHRLPKWKDYVSTAKERNRLLKENNELKTEVFALKETNRDLRDRLKIKEKPEGVNLIIGKSITECGFSTRTVNCLLPANIRTVYDLTRMTPERVMSINQLGRKSLREIEEFLHANDLSLANYNYGSGK